MQFWPNHPIEREFSQGFTLVELAIVMTIIGLLIGGVLKGQELMLNARLTSTIAQVKSYDAATTLFKDTYDSLPGDMTNAAIRLPGCTSACNPDVCLGCAGNNVIGWADWATNYGNISAYPANSGASVNRESQLYWVHLLLADFITGITPQALTTTAAAPGITHPAAKIGGWFTMGYLNGTVRPPGATAVPGSGPTGQNLLLTNDNYQSYVSDAPGMQPLSASKAANIDRKMDDGSPVSGYVQAYGVTTSCIQNGAAIGYREGVTGLDCGLLFRIGR